MATLARRCWICGSAADSAEHKFKKSVHKKLFPFAPHAREAPAYHYKEGNRTSVRGPNSNQLKYEKCLCSRCNDTRTQPFDKAYDRFVEFLLPRLSALHELERIDWRDVYGERYRIERERLELYLMKHLGSAISNIGLAVPSEVRNSVMSATLDRQTRFFISINTDIFLASLWNSRLGYGELMCMRSLSTGKVSGFHHHQSIGCLELHIYFNYRPGGEANGTDIFSDKAISIVGRHGDLPSGWKGFSDRDWVLFQEARRILSDDAISIVGGQEDLPFGWIGRICRDLMLREVAKGILNDGNSGELWEFNDWMLRQQAKLILASSAKMEKELASQSEEQQPQVGVYVARPS